MFPGVKIITPKIQAYHDVPLLGKLVAIIFRKRRYFRTFYGKHFLEHYTFLSKYHRQTIHLVSYVLSLL